MIVPGTTTSPAPSPELGRDIPTTRGHLHRWQVPALAFSPDTALTLLAGIDDDGAMVTYGSDVRYLAVVAGFACDVATRRRVLPGIAREPEGIAARWRPWVLPARESDWDALYGAHLPRIYNYFRYRVGDGPDAEDLTAVTFEKAWRHRARFRRDLGAFTTWLYAIARNVAVDHWRRRRDTAPLDEAAALDTGHTPATEAPAHPKRPKPSPHEMPSPHKPAPRPSPHP